MKLVLTGGGTAGHITPALALAEELKNRGHEVYFAGCPGSLEERLARSAQLEFKAFESAGFNRSKPLSLFASIKKIARSQKQAKAWFKSLEPDCVIGFGGYVSLPLMRAAHSLNIPCVIHEQNSVMGLANKHCARFASYIALTYPLQNLELPQDKTVIIGNPIRQEFMNPDAKRAQERYGIDNDELVLLVFGGSLGARSLNKFVLRLKDELLKIDKLHIIHIAGKHDFDALKEELQLNEEESKTWNLVSYEDNMASCMACADLILSRAGASSLAEIAALRVPSLLVPYPHATANHQFYNAQSLVESGCARMIEDANLEQKSSEELLLDLLRDAQARQDMREAYASHMQINATLALADIIEKLHS